MHFSCAFLGVDFCTTFWLLKRNFFNKCKWTFFSFFYFCQEFLIKWLGWIIYNLKMETAFRIAKLFHYTLKTYRYLQMSNNKKTRYQVLFWKNYRWFYPTSPESCKFLHFCCCFSSSSSWDLSLLIPPLKSLGISLDMLKIAQKLLMAVALQW